MESINPNEVEVCLICATPFDSTLVSPIKKSSLTSSQAKSIKEVLETLTANKVEVTQNLNPWICISCEIETRQIAEAKNKVLEAVNFWNNADSSSDQEQEPEKSVIERGTSPPPRRVYRLKYACSYCPTTFRNFRKYNTHVYKVHVAVKQDDPARCQLCDQRYKSASLCRTHYFRWHHETVHICDICGIQNLTKYQIEYHMRTVHLASALRPFKCGFCPKRFLAPTLRARHERQMHTLEKPFKCFYCGRSFVNKYTLEWHLKRHLGILEYICETCGKEFPLRCFLLAHKRSHGPKVKKFWCTKCKKGFLSQPEVECHPCPRENFIPLQKCKQCGEEFTDKTELTSHRLTVHPSRYACVACCKTFVSEKAYQQHVQKHEKQVRDHVCGICLRSYTRLHYLRLHIRRSHTKEHTHFCQFCSAGFFQSSERDAHEKRMHKDREKERLPYDRRWTMEKIERRVSHFCQICNLYFSRVDEFRSHCQEVHRFVVTI